MNATEFSQKLTILNACKEAREWAKGKDLATAWATCERGDWMLWLAKKVGVELRPLTAAKAACAEFARPYMKEPKRIAALDMAHAFGRGECSIADLVAAANAAAHIDCTANNFSAIYAAAAAYTAAAAHISSDLAANPAYYAAAANAATAGAYTAANGSNAAYAAANARAETLRKCADEVRKHINIKILLQSL